MPGERESKGAEKAAAERGRIAATSRGAAVPVATRRSAEARGMLRLQRLIGNARVQRLLAQRAPEDGMSLEELLAGLRDDAPGAAPLPATMLKAIGALSDDEALSAYLVESNRRTVREAYNETDARRILGALLKKPYTPGELAESYADLKSSDLAAWNQVNEKANKRLESETGVSEALDFSNPLDRPFARRWLMLRDQVMEERNEEEVRKLLKESILEHASSLPLLDLRVELDGLDGPMKRSLRSDKAFMISLRDAVGTAAFPECVEDLGRRAPTGVALRSSVHDEIEAAWRDSNPDSPSEATSRKECDAGSHEEGGWVYMNLLDGSITVERADRDLLHFEPDKVWIDLMLPPDVEDSILVANFHTHAVKRLTQDPSGDDQGTISDLGVPGLLRSHKWTKAFPYGNVVRRLRLTGAAGYPGPQNARERPSF